MGSLDQPEGTQVKREIKIFDVSGMSISQIENSYNSNFGQKGWRIIQIQVLNAKPYIVCEREI